MGTFLCEIRCYTMVMFALPNYQPHVSSAAAQVCSGLLTLFTCLTRIYQLLTRGLKKTIFP